MQRKKKMVIMSHCILNQNAVVYDLARSGGAFTEVVGAFIACDYGIYQLPCPETRFAGLKREKRSYEGYDTADFRKLCQRMADEVIGDIERYKESGYSVEYCVGIAQSPTCDISRKRGHLWQMFLPLLQAMYPKVQCIDVPKDYIDIAGHVFIKQLKEKLHTGSIDCT